MKTKIIEAVSDGNWGKFMIGRWDTEWEREAKAPGYGYRGRSLLRARGWGPRHLWVCDLETGEGAVFAPGGLARNDLAKHRIHVCPLFEFFLEWLYKQDLSDLGALPDLVDLAGAPFAWFRPRQPGPHPGWQALTLAYWQDGRMQIDRAGDEECTCGEAAAHEDVHWSGAELVDGTRHGLPREVKVWCVATGAPTLSEAIDRGRVQGRTLAASRNPLLLGVKEALEIRRGEASR